MKKLFVIAALALSSAAVCSAQSKIFCSADNHAYFGARFSIDAAIPGDYKGDHTSMDVLKNGAGFSFGAVYNRPIVYNLYVEPGFLFYYDTMGYVKANETFGKESLREFGFRIPVMAGYHFDFEPVRVRVFTGPEFRVGLSGKTHFDDTINGVDVSGSYSMYDYYNRADVMWRFGVGADYQKFTLSLSGAVGMCNQLKNTPGVTMHRNVFNLTLGYNF